MLIERPADRPVLYDLEALARQAAVEQAHDEGVKVRVSQDDIRNLVAKRRKEPR